jgi:hypothetical protein
MRLPAVVALGLGLLALGETAAEGAAAADPGPPRVAPAGRALLSSGPDLLHGLPFFGPNAIAGLGGEYLVGAEAIPLWFTRVTLSYGGAWKEGGGFPVVAGAREYSLTTSGRSVIAWKYARYSLIISFPSETAELRRFASALLLRFAFFFENAATDAELSFPATVEY